MSFIKRHSLRPVFGPPVQSRPPFLLLPLISLPLSSFLEGTRSFPFASPIQSIVFSISVFFSAPRPGFPIAFALVGFLPVPLSPSVGWKVFKTLRIFFPHLSGSPPPHYCIVPFLLNCFAPSLSLIPTFWPVPRHSRDRGPGKCTSPLICDPFFFFDT